MKAVENGFFVPAVSFIILAISVVEDTELVANEQRRLVVGSLEDESAGEVRQFITPGKRCGLRKKRLSELKRWRGPARLLRIATICRRWRRARTISESN